MCDEAFVDRRVTDGNRTFGLFAYYGINLAPWELNFRGWATFILKKIRVKKISCEDPRPHPSSEYSP